MVQLTVEHPDGSTETIPQTVGWTRRREIGKMRRVLIDVERDLAQAVTLNEKEDLIHLGTIDTLRLTNVQSGGSTYRLKCFSLEWDSNRVKPTVGGDLREGTDQDLINALIGEVPTWSAGTVNSYTGDLNFVFNHAHRNEALRRIERNTPGEVRFRDGGTVDYTQSLGSDRSGSVELSASAGTIEEGIEITKRGRKLDGTHFVVIGAHEGEAQPVANLVPDDDPASYPNRVDYTTSRWSAGDTRDWDRWENKDVTDQSTLETEAEALAEEITEPLIEAKAPAVAGVSPVLNVGDWVQVVKPEAGLDRKMRVHRITTNVEGATRTDEVLLSTRTIARDDDTQDLRSIRQFNTAFQGSSVVLQAGGFLQPITADTNALVPFFYPDIEYEHLAEVQVRSIPYRSFVGAAGHTHGVDATSAAVVDSSMNVSEFGSGNVTVDPPAGNVVLDSFTATTIEGWPWIVTMSIATASGETDDFGNVGLNVRDTTTGETYNTRTDYSARPGNVQEAYGSRAIYRDLSGDNIEIRIGILDNQSGNNVDLEYSYEFIRVAPHTHDIDSTTNSTAGFEPGVNRWDGVDQSPLLEASNVDVLVNGSTVHSDIGSGSFTTTEDITGELTRGAWNAVELSSDSRGFVSLAVATRAYEQIGKV